MASGKTFNRTIKHEDIRTWAERRNAKPALVRFSSDAIRIKFGNDEPMHEPIEWNKWFEIFDEKSFVFLYEEPGFGYKVVPRKEEDGGAASGH